MMLDVSPAINVNVLFVAETTAVAVPFDGKINSYCLVDASDNVTVMLVAALLSSDVETS